MYLWLLALLAGVAALALVGVVRADPIGIAICVVGAVLMVLGVGLRNPLGTVPAFAGVILAYWGGFHGWLGGVIPLLSVTTLLVVWEVYWRLDDEVVEGGLRHETNREPQVVGVRAGALISSRIPVVSSKSDDERLKTETVSAPLGMFPRVRSNLRRGIDAAGIGIVAMGIGISQGSAIATGIAAVGTVLAFAASLARRSVVGGLVFMTGMAAIYWGAVLEFEDMRIWAPIATVLTVPYYFQFAKTWDEPV